MKVIVVGAGASGLTAAQTLSRGHRVTVVDRIPASGGVLGYDHQIIRHLHSACVAAGVSFALGTTALRWEGQRVLLAGPQRIQWAPADHLVYAGGIRPGTPAEVGLVGPRLAGVLTATVAVHLAEAGVVIGHRVAIIGGGYWADRSRTELSHSGSEIIQVVPPHESAVSDGPVAYTGWRATEVRGAGRVSELIIAKDGAVHRLMCDAVILAGGVKPLRNVDGAVGEGDGVTFIQRAEANDPLGAVTDYARRTALEVNRELGIAASNHRVEEAEL
jgi:NADPH-dependent 2,4-dienoyl-CoA reductase/sulfur reductase-like enzyme